MPTFFFLGSPSEFLILVACVKFGAWPLVYETDMFTSMPNGPSCFLDDIAESMTADLA